MRGGRLIAPTTWLLLLLLVGSGCAEETTSSQTAQGAQSEQAGVIYIPAELDECFVELDKLLTPEEIARLRSGPEDQLALYHFGLGMWLRNNWGLWSASRLAIWFNERGIHHPDDMSAIILTSYWRHLNGKSIELDQQIEHYRAYWKKVGNQ